MTDQILSQEEIDALLGAMARGEVDLEEQKQVDEQIKTYDLTTQSVMLREHLHALEEINDKFSNLLSDSLCNTLQKSLDVEYVSSEMVKYGEFLQGFSAPTSFSIFTMEPLIGSALLAIEPNLVFSMIDCMFGGDGKPLTQVRDFTLIEQRMMSRFGDEVLKSFEAAWAEVHPIKTAIKKSETKPEFVHILTPNELVIVIVFAIKGTEFAGNIHFCLSYLMLEPIKEKLSSAYLRDKDELGSWSRQIQMLMKDTEVSLVAELGHSANRVRDILGLEVDDVLKLNTGPEDSVVVKVENMPKFLGLPGVIKGNRAVELTKTIRSNREQDTNGQS